MANIKFIFIFLAAFSVICGTQGRLTIYSGPLIQGQPAVLFCNIPNYVTSGFWTRNSTSTSYCPPPPGDCFPTSQDGYQFSNNASGISVSIPTIDRGEQQNWRCGVVTTGEQIDFQVDYWSNVFVIPTMIVYGLEQNVTLSDNTDITLTIDISSMNPGPNVTMYYSRNSMIEILPFEVRNQTDTTTVDPEKSYRIDVVISADQFCNATISPRIRVSPIGLAEEFSTNVWTTSSYITFPTCKNEITTVTGFGTSFQADTISTDPITSERVTSPAKDTSQLTSASSGKEVELAVGISVCCVVLIIVAGYVMILVAKRKRNQDNFDNFSHQDTNSQSYVPSIIANECVTDYDVDFVNKVKPIKSSDENFTSYPVDVTVDSSPAIAINRGFVDSARSVARSDVRIDASACVQGFYGNVGAVDTPRTYAENQGFAHNERSTNSSLCCESLEESSTYDGDSIFQQKNVHLDSGDEILFVLKM